MQTHSEGMRLLARLQSQPWRDVAIIIFGGWIAQATVRSGRVVIYSDIPYEIYASDQPRNDDDFCVCIDEAVDLVGGPLRGDEVLARAADLERIVTRSFGSGRCTMRIVTRDANGDGEMPSHDGGEGNCQWKRLIATAADETQLIIAVDESNLGGLVVSVERPRISARR